MGFQLTGLPQALRDLSSIVPPRPYYYARQKAEAWWRRRSNEPVPRDSEEAVEMARAGALAQTLAITVQRKAGDKYDRVVSHQLGPKPPRLESEEGLPEYVPFNQEDDMPFADEDVPF